MNTLSSIFKAHKEYKELMEKAEKLRASQEINVSDEYTTCLHFHYPKPFISIWLKCDNMFGGTFEAMFEIGEEGLVTLVESGNYDLTIITEMSEVISRWLEEEV